MEKIDLPAGGRPHLLTKSVKELREEVKYYLSFSNEEVFQGVALPKKEDDQSLETLPTNVPKTPCAPELATESRGPKFLGWGKILQSLPTSGGHVGDLPTIHSLEAKRRTNSAPLGWTSKASNPFIRDSHPIQTLLASTGISSHLTNNSTVQLCRGDSLSTDTTALGNGL